MGLVQEIAQLFLLGFRGCTLPRDHWLTGVLAETPPGGVILFDRNVDRSVQNIESPTQLATLTATLQQQSCTPLLIAVDQEGGLVCRLKERDGFLASASAAQLAELGLEATRDATKRLAGQLAAMGINLNFAPVVDLNLNPKNPIIARYERSFGDNPAAVTAHAQAVIEAHHQARVACCLKHFPGHGSAGGDSHLGFVDVSTCWQPIELEPYRQLIDLGYADGIMTAHLVNRQLDPSQIPATLSPRVIDQLLRRDLGFTGVVFSDDLQMRAISNGWSLSGAIQQAILAGVDMLVIGNNLDPREDVLTLGIRAVHDLLDSGRIDSHRILASTERIARLKATCTG
ncbi:MAG: glycoside hydrolase family 3 N-terminal domain-containing protein [Desulfobulbus sp.]|nr:glycoside hydrolase family 3 N-terminal domain-containing protein [Desulfobulbus sp.]